MSDAELMTGLQVIAVLCLLVIAMSQYRMAYSEYSYMDDLQYVNSGPSVRHQSLRSDKFTGDGQHERPVYWNLGSVDETNAELVSASRDTQNLYSQRANELIASGMPYDSAWTQVNKEAYDKTSVLYQRLYPGSVPVQAEKSNFDDRQLLMKSKGL